MNRRGFLLVLAAGTASALTGCRPGYTPPAPQGAADPVIDLLPTVVVTTDTGAPEPTTPAPRPQPTGIDRVAPDSWINELPGTGNNLALTVDDGISSEVVAAYIQFAEDTGARFTFFVTGSYPAWTDNADRLRPLVESGQIQLGNHTWSHPDLRTLSDRAVARELGDTEDFIVKTYGVSARPFFRPPFGYVNDRVRRVADNEGYEVTTMWLGSLADSSLISEQRIVENARQWFTAQRVVIGHANFKPVTTVYGQLLDIIRERNLQLVTLNDVFLTSATAH